MRFMLLLKANDESEAGVMPSREEAMREELQRRARSS
jgi:hypothetical protein